ncbi:hypothetical protein PGT21_021407 [Puccinia graminis f. sp. tritici]|uniref:Uncharacterized protein n=1 Tax=Puccinia graminis f. sp. tritici TaxID=56615 RepID=A0A5B0NN85_PUCGR|nr:hypothetical protein PGT21_021407 [Puccinia graminis f. sp. tritici]
MNDDVMFVLLRIGTSVWFMDDDDRSLVIPETSFLPHTNTSNINSSNSKYNSTKKTSLNRGQQVLLQNILTARQTELKSTLIIPTLLPPPSLTTPPATTNTLIIIIIIIRSGKGKKREDKQQQQQQQVNSQDLNSPNPVPLSLRSHRPPQGTCKLYTRISSSGSD